MLAEVKTDPNAIIKEGLLVKKSGTLMSSWEARYFVLQGGKFAYYKGTKKAGSRPC